eukprot:5154136-Karenia_brevis.AAC.1
MLAKRAGNAWPTRRTSPTDCCEESSGDAWPVASKSTGEGGASEGPRTHVLVQACFEIPASSVADGPLGCRGAHANRSAGAGGP